MPVAAMMTKKLTVGLTGQKRGRSKKEAIWWVKHGAIQKVGSKFSRRRGEWSTGVKHPGRDEEGKVQSWWAGQAR